MPTVGTREPMLQTSNGRNPRVATRIPTIRKCRCFIAISSCQGTLLLRRFHDLEQLRDAEYIAHTLRQIPIEITGYRDLGIEIYRRVFSQRSLDEFTETDLETRCIGKERRTGCRNRSVLDVWIEHNCLTWEKCWTITRHC